MLGQMKGLLHGTDCSCEPVESPSQGIHHQSDFPTSSALHRLLYAISYVLPLLLPTRSQGRRTIGHDDHEYKDDRKRHHLQQHPIPRDAKAIMIQQWRFAAVVDGNRLYPSAFTNTPVLGVAATHLLLVQPIRDDVKER